MTHQGPPHKHVPLMNGRAKAAQVYPDTLCRAVCRGLKKNELLADKQGQYMLAQLNVVEEVEGAMKHEVDRMLAECRTVEEDDGIAFLSAYDDVSGALLDPR